MKKKKFLSPLILQEVRISTENNFLASVVENLAPVESTGQQVAEHDFSQETFNHNWE